MFYPRSFKIGITCMEIDKKMLYICSIIYWYFIEFILAVCIYVEGSISGLFILLFYLLNLCLFQNEYSKWTYLDSVGNTLVFSDDNVFSYNRVERRCIIPPPLLGPTVWFPLVGSNFDEILVLAGLDAAKII